jgi:hypothetical protein
LCFLCLFVANFCFVANHKGERLFTRSLAIVLGVRGLRVARGVFLSMRRFNGYDFSWANISEIFLRAG